MDIEKIARSIQEELINIRRDFHMHPELDFQVDRTVKKIKEFLHKEGIEYRETSKNGICGIIRGNGEKTIGIRADIDALPMEEKRDVTYHSKISGRMHACGHDVHTTILLGTAKVLNSIKENLNGNVKLFFEPAEETTGGAKHMIKENVLENPKVDAIIGLHVEPNINCGKIGIKRGVVNAASNPFNIKIKGKGGHGAYPHATVDPITISANVINALQSVVSREISPTDPAVITIGSIHGGTTQNIIPDEVEISGIIRTMTLEDREYAKKRVTDITKGIVESMRGSCDIDIQESYPCLYNDDYMFELLKSSASNTLKSENVTILENPTMGVESFAYFSLERPSVFYYLGTGSKLKDTEYPLHNSYFDVDEDSINVGVRVNCNMVLDFLNKNR